VDLELDSYLGIDNQVEYSCSAEMIYTGSMMKYTCKTKEVFSVINYRQPKLKRGPEVTLTLANPLIKMQMHLDSTRLNLETEWISGWCRALKFDESRGKEVESVVLELVQ